VTGKGMYAMSHHHTYYVTSSYIVCPRFVTQSPWLARVCIYDI
jgi:hypothetical protein